MRLYAKSEIERRNDPLLRQATNGDEFFTVGIQYGSNMLQ